MPMEGVKAFVYYWSVLDRNGGTDVDVTAKTGKAWVAFRFKFLSSYESMVFDGEQINFVLLRKQDFSSQM